METNQSAFNDWDKWFARANERSELAINPTLLGTVAVVAPMLKSVHMPLRWILGWRARPFFHWVGKEDPMEPKVPLQPILPTNIPCWPAGSVCFKALFDSTRTR